MVEEGGGLLGTVRDDDVGEFQGRQDAVECLLHVDYPLMMVASVIYRGDLSILEGYHGDLLARVGYHVDFLARVGYHVDLVSRVGYPVDLLIQVGYPVDPSTLEGSVLHEAYPSSWQGTFPLTYVEEYLLISVAVCHVEVAYHLADAAVGFHVLGEFHAMDVEVCHVVEEHHATDVMVCLLDLMKHLLSKVECLVLIPLKDYPLSEVAHLLVLQLHRVVSEVYPGSFPLYSVYEVEYHVTMGVCHETLGELL